jgi:pimeloyl-ACP methyl ester carboxylesterase
MTGCPADQARARPGCTLAVLLPLLLALRSCVRFGMGGAVDDLVVKALGELVPGGVRRRELRRGSRALCWVEAGSGGPPVVLDASLGQPGSLAWAGVLAPVAAHTRVIAYDRAGTGVSDPVSPLTLGAQIGDLAALIQASGARCVLAGHSWGGLLAQLAALRYPGLIAGLVLIDPADENFRAALPPDDQREIAAMGPSVLDQYSRGELGKVTRDRFRPFARRLADDPRVQALILDACAWCYARRSQAQMIQDENQLYADSVPLIRRARASAALPDVPVVVVSATTGMPEDQRQTFTQLHAALAAAVPRGTHVVLADTGHLIPQERPERVAEAINDIIEDIRQQDTPTVPGP